MLIFCEDQSDCNDTCFYNVRLCYHRTTYFWECILLTRKKRFLVSYFLFETFLLASLLDLQLLD